MKPLYRNLFLLFGIAAIVVMLCTFEDGYEQIRNNMLRNVTLADAEIKMFGDRTVLAQIAQLVAYIRHAIKNDTPTEIKLSICKSDSTVAGAEFMFDLNGCQVPDLVPQPEVFIN